MTWFTNQPSHLQVHVCSDILFTIKALRDKSVQILQLHTLLQNIVHYSLT